ncbi:hypothetical protein [Paraliomyxa miuraensis]|uniref:hypothetical protein n=1 Tax=Paraliomyxa miuraensis TaxID=376150 RepID=UPI00224D57AE|nr:hypothetical protein [Paraliomyxa miuraensis]MCX4245563.1 hypothetical protein [Paraliomyxa miuraensis]
MQISLSVPGNPVGALAIGDEAASLGRVTSLSPHLLGKPLETYFWAWPLLKQGESGRPGTTMAVRLLPKVDFWDCPMVWINGTSISTVATRVRGSLPMVLLWSMLRTQADTWRAMRAAWPRLRDDLSRLDAALHGEGLDRFTGLLFDDALLARLDEAQPLSVERESVMADAAQALDDDIEHVSYRRVLQLQLEGQPPAPPSESEATRGRWAPALAMASYHAARTQQRPDLSVPWARRLVDVTAGVDLVGVAGPSQLPNVSGRQVVGLQFAARELKDQPTTEGPVSHMIRGVVEHITQGVSYDGASHITLADALRDAGQPRAAWDALAQATFHASTAMNAEVRDAARAAGLALAQEQDWTTIVEALAAGSQE